MLNVISAYLLSKRPQEEQMFPTKKLHTQIKLYAEVDSLYSDGNATGWSINVPVAPTRRSTSSTCVGAFATSIVFFKNLN